MNKHWPPVPQTDQATPLEVANSPLSTYSTSGARFDKIAKRSN